MKENAEPRLLDMSVREAVRHTIRKVKPFAIGAIVGAVGIVGIALATAPDAHAATPTTSSAGLPPCAEEDSDNCVWDAAARGNRTGQSFVRLGGRTYTLAN